MCDEEIKTALAETSGVVRAIGGAVMFIACDAEVHAMQRVSTWQQAAKLVKGGGGTSFVPAINALAADRRNPIDICVYLTDGCGTAPGKAPPFRMIWALIGDSRRPCDWGDVVEVR
jgi:predicted metal-dependent peptidase